MKYGGLISVIFHNFSNKFESEIDGNPAKAEIGEWDKVTLSTRVQIAMQGLSTSYGPTDLNSSNLEIAEKLFEELKVNIQNLKFNMTFYDFIFFFKVKILYI